MKKIIFLAAFFFCISAGAEVIKFDYVFQKPKVEKGKSVGESARISMQDLKEWSEPGKPVLPFKSVNILVPYGKKVMGIKFIPQEAETINGYYNVEPGSPIAPTFSSNIKINTVKDYKIYSQSFPYPEKISSPYIVQRLSGYDVLICRLYPAQYIPNEGKLFYYKNIRIEVTLSDNFTIADEQRKMLLSNNQTLTRVKNMVDNKNILSSYSYGFGIFNSKTSQPYDYIIITNAALKDSFQRIVNWKISRGLEAHVFTTDSIYANFTGVDNQEKIRNFIKDCYTTWSATAHPLKWVVLGGDEDVIPIRGCFGWSTDGTIAFLDSTMPCDLYYSGLDGNWDTDGDGVYGEGDISGGGTGTAGEEADLLSEIAVGRITVDNPEEAHNYINKLLHCESTPDANYLNQALFVGEQLDASTTGGMKKDGVAYLMPQCNITRLYEPEMGTGIVLDSIESRLNANPYIVNHLGHANWNIMFGGWGGVHSLTNTEYFLLYSQGCYTNAFDNATSGSGGAFSENFIFAEHGAFAYIGDSRYGWYGVGSNEGPGEKFDREFIDALFTEKITNLGNALQDAKEDLSSSISATGTMRWCYFELNFLGDPETPIIIEYSAPIANISSIPKNYGTTGIIGTAKAGDMAGATFLNYHIEYGLGTNPSVWVPISDTFYTPVTDDTLCYIDTRILPEDSTVTIKLVVKDSTGRTTNSRVYFQAKNCEVALIYVKTCAEGDTILVLGCAAGKNFTSYVVESKGTGGWDTVGMMHFKNGGTSEVLWDTLALWNLDGFNTGTYTVRLTVNGTDTFYAQTGNLLVDNCLLMTPKNGDVLRMDHPVYIMGNAAHPNFTYYNIKYGLGTAPTSWDTSGIILDSGGTLPVRRGMLGTLNPANMIPDTTYTLRLYVGSEGSDQIQVRFQQFFLTGWPIQYHGGCNSPVVYDIDRVDNDLEVFVTVSNGYWVFGSGGATEWCAGPDTCMLTEPSIGNIANYYEGFDEFVMASSDSLFAIHYISGMLGKWKPVIGFPLPIPGIKNSPPVLAQIDTTECLEIIHCSSNDSIYAISGSTQTLSGWPKYAPGILTAAVGNLDSDSLMEIVFGDSTGKIWTVNGDGSSLPGWPVTLDGKVLTPTLGDIDKDGELEIVVATSEKLYVLKKDGTVFTGWTPIPIEIGFKPGVFQSPTLGNLDSDSLLEVVITTFCGEGSIISVFNQDGTFVPGWPDTIYMNLATSPIIGDMDGDAEQEIIVNTVSGILYAYNTDGTFVTGYPRGILTQVWDGVESPAGTFADLNKDGHMDVIWCSKYYTFAFNTRGGNPQLSDWPTYKHDVRHTGCYDFKMPVGVEEQPPSLAPWVGKPLPNPFKGTTLLSFSVPKVTAVKINVFNLAGQNIKTLLDEKVKPGFHSVNWTGKNQNGEKVPSGIYFIRVKGIGDITTRKTVLLR
ncbi:MAG: C25 family cysteine peptidase [bacterium]|nr:C25 family cysteine peptidase [bacterium]